MNPHELLLKAVRERQEKLTEFNEGILTADRYVKTISECVGSDICYRYAATKAHSFDDILKKSANVLTYNNPDMVVEDLYGKDYEWTEIDKDGDSRTLTLPKNTLMVFKHVLTTPRKDRDGDVMRTQGANPDLKMLLLWQHVHTLPIGKMLSVYSQNSKALTLISCIVDINDLAHDSAVMVESGMGRFSHGFKAIEFDKNKDGGGFDVKKFDIMEESLVSVPSNTDAEVEEVILGLAEGGKLTSVMMKSIGKDIRSKKDKSVAVGTDVSKLKKEENHEHKADESTKTKCTGDAGCGCGCGKTSASEKADVDPNEDGTEAGSNDKEMMMCPKCGGKIVDGKCMKCGYVMDKEIYYINEKEAEFTEHDTKAGRSISAKNKDHLEKAHASVKAIHETEHLMSRGGHALAEKCMGHIKSVIDTTNNTDGGFSGEDAVESLTVKSAMSYFLANAEELELRKMVNVLKSLTSVEDMRKETESLKELIS